MRRRGLQARLAGVAVAVGAAVVMLAPAAHAQVCVNSCPGQWPPTQYVTTTAAAVHGPDGLVAAGWRCQHVQGRAWFCVWRPHHR